MPKPKTERNSSAGVRVEEAIFAALSGSHPELSLFELLQRLDEQGVGDEETAKAAITRLLSESKLKMTPRRHIRLSLKGNSLPASAGRVAL